MAMRSRKFRTFARGLQTLNSTQTTLRRLVEWKWWPNTPLTVPVMVICTQNSGLDLDNKEKMQRLYPYLDYTELTTCGHFIHMEQPEMFNEKLRQWLLHNLSMRQTEQTEQPDSASTFEGAVLRHDAAG